LGHVIDKGKLRMDSTKVKAIFEWKPPIEVTELRSFLGLVNYYRKFIQGYSVIATPFIDLLKKGKGWIWGQESHHAFETLKKVITKEPVLALLDLNKSFELYTDAFNFAVGKVLMQGHPLLLRIRRLMAPRGGTPCKKRR